MDVHVNVIYIPFFSYGIHILNSIRTPLLYELEKNLAALTAPTLDPLDSAAMGIPDPDGLPALFSPLPNEELHGSAVVPASCVQAIKQRLAWLTGQAIALGVQLP